MSNIAVVYKSDYGAARSYAIYIAKALSADLYDLRRIREFDFGRYDTIIYGGGLYAGKVNGLHFLSSHAQELAGKKLAVFTTGLADPTMEETVRRTERTVAKALAGAGAADAPVFCFRGALDYSELSFRHRAAMAALHGFLSLKNPARLSPDEQTLLSTYGKSVDFIDLPAADPLIKFIQGD
ncbi:MAG: flavodoxin domain-containing protein [Oscillospiraceae bacterium]|jgi:menaquinone-dependent protoporphyrinogen IX oxidase